MKFWLRRAPSETGWFARSEATFSRSEVAVNSCSYSKYNYRQAVPLEELPEAVRGRLAALIVAGPDVELPDVGKAYLDYFFIYDPEGEKPCTP